MLVAVGNTGFSAYQLPMKDRIVIGRSPECDVPIDDATISREHAVIHFDDKVWLEDVGSTNGTRVREPVAWIPEVDTSRAAAREHLLEPGERVELLSGSIIKLGSLMLMFQPRQSHRRPRRLWPHALFEDRLEEECARAAGRENTTFAVLRIRLIARITGDDRFGDTAEVDHKVLGLHPNQRQPTHSTRMRSTSEEVLGALTRPSDVIAVDDDEEYDVLLVQATIAEAEDIVRRLTEAYAKQSMTAQIGMACYPRDGRMPESLLMRANEALSPGGRSQAPRPQIIVRDPQMIALHELIGRVAHSDITVLLLGETGVGKEVIAETLHKASPRKDGPLVRINCAAMPEPLLEGELFGFERGAFTGADKAKEGLFETADKGTLFLDEIGEIPMSTQVKLLRVLEDRNVMRVGARQPRPIDVRIISATNRDLEDEVARGRFREDLYFRLHVFPLEIPPLRARPLEIEPLAAAFLDTMCAQIGRTPVPELSRVAAGKLRDYAWPGNIRELRNVMQRALLLCNGPVITDAHLPIERMGRTIATRRDDGAYGDAVTTPPPRATRSRSHDVTIPPQFDETPAPHLRETVENLERDRITAALDECAGNQTRAAKLLGITRKVLLARLDRYGIARPRK